MSKLRCQISISLDGFVAGPNQSKENPLGEGGEQLHEWVFPLAAWRKPHGMEGGEVNESSRIIEESLENIGAAVMGRNMFGPPGGGDWGDGQWKGWWGDDPPYHYPVFILTHHPRDPLVMEGGTTFHFVTDGPESALEQAKKLPAARTSGSGAVARPSSSTLQRDCSTSSSSTWHRCCSATAPGSSTAATEGCSSSRSGPSRPRRHTSHVPGGEVSHIAAARSPSRAPARKA